METNKIKIYYCQEVYDSTMLCKDLANNYNDYFKKLPNKDVMIPKSKIVELIEYSNNSDIYLSLFILCGRKI